MVYIRNGDLAFQCVEEYVETERGGYTFCGVFNRYEPLYVVDVDPDGQAIVGMAPDGSLFQLDGGPLYIIPAERLGVPARKVIARLKDQYNNHQQARSDLRQFIRECGCPAPCHCSPRHRTNALVTTLLVLMFLAAMAMQPLGWSWLPYTDKYNTYVQEEKRKAVEEAFITSP